MLFAAAFVVLSWLAQAPDPMRAGLKALEESKYDLAVEHFKNATAAEPGDYAAHFHLGLSYSLLERDAEAIPAYRKALELKPGLYEAQLNLGIVLLRSRRSGEAVPLLRAAHEQKPAVFRPAFYLAEALLASGNAPEAEKVYQTAIALDAKSAPALAGLGRSLGKQGKLDEARKHIEQAAALDPTYRDLLLELAGLYESKGDRAAAVALYTQFPEQPAARERAGQLLLESGDTTRAVEELKQAVSKSPTPANRMALAAAYIRTKQMELALPLLEQAVADAPDNRKVRMAYGRALRDARHYPGAAREFQQVAFADPNAKDAWSELAAVQILAKDYEQALQSLDRVRALGGESPGLLYFRAVVLDNLKQYKPAADAYQQFLAASQGKNPDEEFKARQRLKVIAKVLSKR